MNFLPSTPELQKIAKEQLHERPETIENDLQIFKDWIIKQPHLNAKLDDAFLLSYLRNSKYRLEKAKEKFDFYHTYRSMCPEFYLNRVPITSNVQKLIKSGTIIDLPVYHPIDSGIITVTTMGNLAHMNCSVTDVMKMFSMHNDRYIIYNENATISGQHSIIDLRDTNMIIATQCTANIKKMVNAIQNVYPIRIINFHLMNLKHAPAIFEPIIKMFKGFLKTKLANRIIIHDNYESLYKAIPQEILPSSLGGHGGTIQSIMEKYCQDVYYKNTEWFQQDELYKSDESKRIGGPAFNEMFGTEGSFRKMDID